MRFHFITLFPDTIRSWLDTSILGRAKEAGLFEYAVYQLRDFSSGNYKSVDDTPYGGGGGMVLRIEPLVKALDTIFETVERDKASVVYFTPKGKKIDQPLLNEMVASEITDYVLVCGHYEGTDQRFIDNFVDQEISLGDFVLTGGELPAVAFADAMIRQKEGTLGCEGAAKKESFNLKDPDTGIPLLEYPHYTRPADFRGMRVPEVLLSGDHGRIETWRLRQSRNRTRQRQPNEF